MIGDTRTVEGVPYFSVPIAHSVDWTTLVHVPHIQLPHPSIPHIAIPKIPH